MAMNPPQQAQTPEAEVILVRGSEEYNEYMHHQGGRIKAVVNGIEDFLSVSGRTLLLVFVLYTTVKGGMTVTGHQVPWPLDILMLAFQVCGLEGSIPGLSRFRESLLLKNTQAAMDDAEAIRKTIKSARTLNFLTGVEIMLAAYAASHNAAIPGLPVTITIANISEFYGYVLLLARLWFITSFIIEMSRLEVKKPKIISKAEHDKQQHEAEQEQIRKDNEALEAEMKQSLIAWTRDQHQHHQVRFDEALASWMGQKSQDFSDLVVSLKQSVQVTLSTEELTASIVASLRALFDTQIEAARQENEAHTRRQLDERFASALANFQLAQAEQAPDLQAILQAVSASFAPQFQAVDRQFQALNQAMSRQQAAVDQAVSRQDATIAQALAQATRVPEKGGTSGAQATNLRQFKPRPAASVAGGQGDEIALQIDPATATREELIAEAKRLQGLGQSTYQIGDLLTKSAKTVQSWLSNKATTSESGELEAVNG